MVSASANHQTTKSVNRRVISEIIDKDFIVIANSNSVANGETNNNMSAPNKKSFNAKSNAQDL